MKGFDGVVTLIGDEPHLPYDRPPLSKQYLAGEWELDRFELAPGGMLDGLDLDLRLGRRAVDLDLVERKVVLHGGEPVPFDEVVLATGSIPRPLPGTPDLDGIHELRTLDDA